MALYSKHLTLEAQAELRRAIDLNPNYAMAHHFYSSCLLTRGAPEEALAENDRARQLDPFGVAVNALRIVMLIHLHRFDDALVQAAKLAELAPQNQAPYIYLTRIYWLQERVPEALEAGKKEAVAKHEDQWLRDQAELEKIYRRSGLQPTLFRAAELMEKHEYPVWAAFEYGNLRDSEKVLQLLRANWDNGDVMLEIKSAPEFDFLRHDPRFLEIEHRVHPDL
jgi:tetratricopeptide (TPR) repeat protein